MLPRCARNDMIADCGLKEGGCGRAPEAECAKRTQFLPGGAEGQRHRGTKQRRRIVCRRRNASALCLCPFSKRTQFRAPARLCTFVKMKVPALEAGEFCAFGPPACGCAGHTPPPGGIDGPSRRWPPSGKLKRQIVQNEPNFAPPDTARVARNALRRHYEREESCETNPISSLRKVVGTGTPPDVMFRRQDAGRGVGYPKTSGPCDCRSGQVLEAAARVPMSEGTLPGPI